MQNSPDPKPDTKTTIIVVQREKFSETKRALETVYRQANQDFELIYISAGAPEAVETYLLEQSKKLGFKLLVFDDFLPPNVARNRAMKHVNTQYVVFIDNDVIVEGNWLAELESCAEETGAALVGPLYCVEQGGKKIVHNAGGVCEFKDHANGKRFHTQHNHVDCPLVDIQDKLERCETGAVEFHCVLVRKDFIDEIGGLDEALISACDHEDLSLQATGRGYKVFFEPKAIVTYVVGGELTNHDLRFFNRRWSFGWGESSVYAMIDKYQIAADDPWIEQKLAWVRYHAMLPYAAKLKWIKKLLGKRATRLVYRFLTWQVGDTPKNLAR